MEAEYYSRGIDLGKSKGKQTSGSYSEPKTRMFIPVWFVLNLVLSCEMEWMAVELFMQQKHPHCCPWLGTWPLIHLGEPWSVGLQVKK